MSQHAQISRVRNLAKNRTVRRYAAPAVLTAALIGVAVIPSATAASTVPANSVGSAQIINGGVWGGDIHDNTIAESKLGWDIRQKIAKAGGTQGPKVDTGPKGDTCAKGENGEPATDVLGKEGVSDTLGPKVIANIGGSFKTQKTKVGEITLPPGKWLLNASAFFARTTAGVPGTRPQLALRVGASETAFGEDFGTILGAEISPAKDRELTGSTVKVVKVSEATKVEVFGFGYNDDGSAAGGGQIEVTADVVAVRIG